MSRVQVDMPTIDTEEAASLIAHHLAMAAALFQALPDGNEVEAMRTALDAQFQGFELEREAADAFVWSIITGYEALDDEDENEDED